jgi:hypothetical protein
MRRRNKGEKRKGDVDKGRAKRKIVIYQIKKK